MYNPQALTKDGKKLTFRQFEKEMDRDLSEGRDCLMTDGRTTWTQYASEYRRMETEEDEEREREMERERERRGKREFEMAMMSEGQATTTTMTSEGRVTATTDGRTFTETLTGQMTPTGQTVTTGQMLVAYERMTVSPEGQILISRAPEEQRADVDDRSERDEDEMAEVLMVDGRPVTPVVTEEAPMAVEVDPLLCPLSSSFVSVDDAALTPRSGSLVKSPSWPSMTPRREFHSATESTPSVSGPVRNLFAAFGMDAKKGTMLGGSKRVVGRKRAVIEDDAESLLSSSSSSSSSISATSAFGLESSKASSSGPRKKGIKRGREVSKEKDMDRRKKGKAEGTSEGNQKTGKGKKKVEGGRKETPESDGVGLCGEPMGVVADQSLEHMSSSVLNAAIRTWATRIDEIRSKSRNLQGKLSGEMKKCVTKIMEGTTLLAIRAEASGDPHFLRMRNLELANQLRDSERENARLEEQLRRMSFGSPSSLRKKKVAKTAVVDPPPPLLDSDDDPDPVNPPTREEFPPLPQRTPRSEEVKTGVKKKVGPRIISDVQLAPPYKERSDVVTAIPAVSASEADWRVAAGSKRRGRVKGDGLPPPPPPIPPVPAKRRPLVRQQLQQPKPRLPRPPASSAVTITGRTEGFSYAEAMRSARENINLEALGIRTSRVRKALNGGLVVEVVGEDSRLKAEELVTLLRSVMKDSAAVSCPIKKRELTVAGFDESVSAEEIAETLSNIGGCSIADIKMGPIRTMSNGMGLVWVQLPVAAAAKVAEEGRIRAGWTMARVELLKARPLQCYKCWTYGHVQNVCRNVIDRRGACFRCGQMGHVAATCKNPVHCAVCHDAGLVASHRLGGPQCMAQDRHDK